ncbi:ABC transporter ATP-binding protein [Pseudogracilibacillus auburnensis]|uniref:Oligopeptide transport system ATP-binding protein n=1 Tax=Pseudogracilibacillus auburnensis TaxID=1494959 RepID=A0A2V3VLA0_9BACI|nr:ABC transporter ATP-binding protein [Pseudogracilibacillus auburnensis]PXW82583.1 oligopeptide transport system ATP-binding protein [Pseudogracilibacillus auburnensis]
MLEVKGLKVRIHSDKGVVKAVNGVSFTIKAGQTVGIVGESGSGKSVLAQSLMRLNPEPTTVYTEGEILFQDRNILALTDKEVRQLRGSDIAMIFQDPMSSLNPVFKIGDQLIDAIRAKQKMSRKTAKQKATELLKDVGISDPDRRMGEYPHQFSGGMRQRVLIAMALASKPKLLIADEPTTALDVTIQAQILQLLKNIQNKYGMAIIIITHDLGVVANMADNILVMYSGRIVEEGSTEDIFYRTTMPYTWSLLRALPRLDANDQEQLVTIKGNPPNLLGEMKGCSFYQRCPFATEQCALSDPVLREIGKDHRVACILSESEFIDQVNQLQSIQ